MGEGGLLRFPIVMGRIVIWSVPQVDAACATIAAQAVTVTGVFCVIPLTFAVYSPEELIEPTPGLIDQLIAGDPAEHVAPVDVLQVMVGVNCCDCVSSNCTPVGVTANESVAPATAAFPVADKAPTAVLGLVTVTITACVGTLDKIVIVPVI